MGEPGGTDAATPWPSSPDRGRCRGCSRRLDGGQSAQLGRSAAPVEPLAAEAENVLLFAADGLRQDIVERYAADRGVPGFADLLRRGAAANGGGMLTQAPPNTGAGWYTMATGAWPGVHGSTNNTFHRNNQAFALRTAAFDPGVLSAETIAQAAERGGKRVIQMEWAGGRNGIIDGPTVDFRGFFSGRGVTTNYVAPIGPAVADHRLRAAVRPSRSCTDGPPPFTDHAVPTATGWTNVPASFSPALETHMRVLDFDVDKYGLDAYIYDSTNDGADQLRPGAVLARRER